MGHSRLSVYILTIQKIFALDDLETFIREKERVRDFLQKENRSVKK